MDAIPVIMARIARATWLKDSLRSNFALDAIFYSSRSRFGLAVFTKHWDIVRTNLYAATKLTKNHNAAEKYSSKLQLNGYAC